MHARLRHVTIAIASVLVSTVVGCGHSEEEWQAQLGKQKQCEGDLASERAAKDKLAKELQDVKDKLASLEGSNKEYSAKAADLKKALDEAEARAKALEAAKKRLEALKARLDELKKFGIDTRIRNGLITIVMPGDVLFPPGKETLSKDGQEVLMQIAKVIKENADLSKRHLQIIGHTDNAPYVGPFKDNVGLSVMRAREVYAFLTTDPAKAPAAGKKKAPPAAEGGGLDPTLLSAAGFGDLDPIAGSRDKQDDGEKKKNRRVEIAILPNADELMKLGDV